MKPQEFRKLIREEVRKVLREEKSNIVKKVRAYPNPLKPVPKIEKLYGSFLSMKGGGTLKFVADQDNWVSLDVNSMLSLLKSDKNYSVRVGEGSYIIFSHKSNDYTVNLYKDDIPNDVIAALKNIQNATPKKVSNNEFFMTLQIDNNNDGFDFPEEYRLPSAIKSKVGKFKMPANEDAYEDAVDRYVAKVVNALTSLVKRAVPGIEWENTDDGFITYRLPKELDAQTKTKLKTLFKGVKSIKFASEY